MNVTEALRNDPVVEQYRLPIHYEDCGLEWTNDPIGPHSLFRVQHVCIQIHQRQADRFWGEFVPPGRIPGCGILWGDSVEAVVRTMQTQLEFWVSEGLIVDAWKGDPPPREEWKGLLQEEEDAAQRFTSKRLKSQ